MKETIQDLKTRRSIKKYKPEQITKNELIQVLEAGMNAHVAKPIDMELLKKTMNQYIKGKERE